MRTRTLWVNRAGRWLIWLLVTAAVAFLVGRAAADSDPVVDVSAPLPPIALGQRAKVSLQEKSIVPVVSADGTVAQDGSNWLLVAPAPTDALAYRLLDPPIAVKALIKGGPTGFACAWAGLGQAGPAAGAQSPVPSSKDLSPSATGVTMRCRIPADVRVVAGMAGTMVLQMGKPTKAQSLPVTAVVGSAKQGQVVVVHDDGATEVRNVTLGVSDIFNIQILGGLKPGEVVLRNPTQADLAQAQEAS